MKLDLDAPRLAVPVSRHDHSLGPPDAAVTMVEYGDYECPYCGRAHGVVKALLLQMRHQLRFVFRNFPLTTVHPQAAMAAQAAEAAALQGKLWEMSDVLLEHQDALELADLQRYAALAGLDLERFLGDMTSERVIARVHEDFRGGVRSGVNGTPAFFINGVRYNGPHDFGSLSAALEGEARGQARP